MAVFDTLFTCLLWSSFLIAPLTGITFVAVLVGLWRRQRKGP